MDVAMLFLMLASNMTSAVKEASDNSMAILSSS